MAFKTNPALEGFEKKHPTAFFVIRLIVSILVGFAGLWLLFSDADDKSVPILMIVAGVLGVICTFILRLCKR